MCLSEQRRVVRKVLTLLTDCCHSHMVDWWCERNRVPRLRRGLSFDLFHRRTRGHPGGCDPTWLIEQTRKEHSWQNFSDPILSAYRCATSPLRVRSTQRCWG